MALGGLTVGLALSPLGEDAGGMGLAAVLGLAGLVLALLRPRTAAPPSPGWLALVLGLALCAGLLAGAARLRAIDRGALEGPTGSWLSTRGFLVAPPRRSAGTVRMQVRTARGKVLVEAHEPVPPLSPGAEVSAQGRLVRPPEWYRSYLQVQGIAMILRSSRVAPTGGRRGGLAGRIDSLRRRAEDALGRGIPAREAALARGFVLGEDDSVDPQTRADFQRSGLAHLVAVSGENVVLLAVLAAPVLAALGLGLRARLLWILALIAIYVPLAGAAPSIQRAGLMGAAGVVATLAGRSRSRLHAVLLAEAITLLLNPRATGDAGWQLSFAAVLGIFLWASPLRELLGRFLGSEGWRRTLCEGLAVTIAATTATAPLMAHDFESVSVTSLLANVLVIPAVAPAMWLGMIGAGLGQLPGFPVEPVNWVNSVLLAYIAQVAAWLGRPGWALAAIQLRSWIAVAATYAAMVGAGEVARRWIRSRRGLAGGRRRIPRRLVAVAVAGAALLALAPVLAARPGKPQRPPPLEVSFLDVGQGDAILLQPRGAGAILVDGGPPGDDLQRQLAEHGVKQLDAAVVTHDQSDHAGGIEEILGAMPVHRLLYAEAGRALLGEARSAGAALVRVAEGSEIDEGRLRLEVLWPPRELLGGPEGDPNLHAIVALARWRGFTMLLTADAEAEAVPIDPGPVDVLKVAHHGSDDAGLGPLLERTVPSLAVISVGADNPYGHPTAGTLATLARHDVPTLRTDETGTVTLLVGRRGVSVETGG